MLFLLFVLDYFLTLFVVKHLVTILKFDYYYYSLFLSIFLTFFWVASPTRCFQPSMKDGSAISIMCKNRKENYIFFFLKARNYCRMPTHTNKQRGRERDIMQYASQTRARRKWQKHENVWCCGRSVRGCLEAARTTDAQVKINSAGPRRLSFLMQLFSNFYHFLVFYF